MAGQNTKPTRTEADDLAARTPIDSLMDAGPKTPEFDEMDVLVDLVEHDESKHEPMGYPSPMAAIEFRIEQQDMSLRDLIPLTGTGAKVS